MLHVSPCELGSDGQLVNAFSHGRRHKDAPDTESQSKDTDSKRCRGRGTTVSVRALVFADISRVLYP